MGWSSWWHAAVAFGAAVAAGIVNAVAGGGTNISFPVLLWLGLPPVTANATNAVALWPGGVAAAWGFGREIQEAPRHWYWLAIPSLAGGAVGAYLLIHTPSSIFRSIAPYLVIGSSALIAAEPAIGKRVPLHDRGRRSTGWLVLAVALQFVISIYGGYFGAGIGILLLTALGVLGQSDIHRANGLKNLYTAALKGVAVAYFVVQSAVVWHAAALMAVGAIGGGYLGAVVGRRVPRGTMRWVVVAIGVLLGLIMLLQVA